MRQSEPWYYRQKNAWYIWRDGVRVNLKVKGEDNEAEARKAWHRLMGGVPLEVGPEAVQGKPKPAKAKPEALPAKPEALTVAEAVKGFLADAEGRVSEGRLKPATVRGYRDFLAPFADGKDGKVKASALTAKVAEAYANRDGWSNSTRHGFLSVLAIALRWSGFPLAGLRKPTMESRGEASLISPKDHAKLLKHAPDYFKPFLTLLHLTGARPGEVARFACDNFDADKGIVVLTEHKTKHKTGKPRIVFLPPEAVALMKGLKAKRDGGALCLNRYGQPYSKDAVVRMMDRLSKKAKVKATAYGYRHSLATDALANGIPDAHVAALLGHSGTTMLHRHYSHLTSKTTVLRDALKSVR